MRHSEGFADPVLVPGPNPRSLHTDTEVVDGATTEVVDDVAMYCSRCNGVFAVTTLACPVDGTAVVELPGMAESR